MPNKPTNQKKKALVIAALALLVLAVPVLAQSSGGGESNIEGAIKENVVKPAVKGIKILTFVYAVAFWASVIVLAIYAFLMLKLGPTTYSKWAGFVELIDNYKRYIIGIVAIPFAIAALMTGVSAIANVNVSPWDVAASFLQNILFKPFTEVQQLFFSGG